jgi:2-C-methyl-D-erythritol 4-phosphate cytidylyltransferase
MAGLLKRFLEKGRREHPYCVALVPAAGMARRMQGRDKVMEELRGMPVIAHTLLALEACPLIDEIIVMTREDLIVPISNIGREYAVSKLSHVVLGGETRVKSVWAGLEQLPEEAELVAIHDSARPFVSQEVLREVLTAGAECGAAAPAIPVKDTIKQAERGLVERTLQREMLYAVQTPQVFEPSLLKGALHKALEEQWELTDDCSAVERLGMSVRLTRGAEENIKLTTPVDLMFGEAILQWRMYPSE